MSLAEDIAALALVCLGAMAVIVWAIITLYGDDAEESDGEDRG